VDVALVDVSDGGAGIIFDVAGDVGFSYMGPIDADGCFAFHKRPSGQRVVVPTVEEESSLKQRDARIAIDVFDAYATIRCSGEVAVSLNAPIQECAIGLAVVSFEGSTTVRFDNPRLEEWSSAW